MAARCPSTLWLFDWQAPPPPAPQPVSDVPHPPPSPRASPRASRRARSGTQAAHLARVASRIGSIVLDFCVAHLGREFVAQDLRDHVVHHEVAAPASPDRILRQLRQEGAVDYIVVDRRRSRYRITAVSTRTAPAA